MPFRHLIDEMKRIAGNIHFVALAVIHSNPLPI